MRSAAGVDHQHRFSRGHDAREVLMNMTPLGTGYLGKVITFPHLHRLAIESVSHDFQLRICQLYLRAVS